MEFNAHSVQDISHSDDWLAAEASAPGASPGNTSHGGFDNQRRGVQASLLLGGEATMENDLVGVSDAIRTVHERVRLFAPSDAPVLICGESGTGKEIVAHGLHQLSPRASGRFVAINCAAIPETLVESELFGHERGAFTGAVTRRQGRFQSAHGGTLFLDEVGELPAAVQAKLLRVLESGTVEPLGSTESQHVDVRLISATHRSLDQRIAQHEFREDLYYRLKVLHVTVPPLRERPEDIPWLIERFLKRLSPNAPAQGAQKLTEAAWKAVRSYAFPGNARELLHAIQYALVVAGDGPIDKQHLPMDVTQGRPTLSPLPTSVQTLGRAMHDFERAYLVRVLEGTGGHKTQAAELLGISRKTLWAKMRAYGIVA